MKSEYTTTDIGKALGIPRERLKDWTGAGFVAPSVPAAGAGTKAFFLIEDLYRLQLFSYLINAGLKRKDAAEVVSFFHKKIAADNYLIAKSLNGEVLVETLPGGADAGRPIIDLISGVSTYYQREGELKSKWGAPIRMHDPEVDGKPKRGAREWDHLLVVNIARIRNLVDKLVKDL